MPLSRRPGRCARPPPAPRLERVEARAWLEQLDAGLEDERAALPVLALVAGQGVELDEEELRGALRRAVLLLAAGGDPHRDPALDGRPVTALARDLDTLERRAALADGLAGLRATALGLPKVRAALDRLLDPELAWRSFAAALIAEELGEEGDG